jgi:hypothetical protein
LCHHRSQAERPLACRSDDRAHRARVLDLVDSLRVASALALLLVGGRRHRPLLTARHGICGLSRPTILACGSRGPGAARQRGGPSAPLSRLRPRPAVRRQGVPALVTSPRNPPALRSYRSVWQPRRDRALHPDAQERMHPTSHRGSVPFHGNQAGSRALLLLVLRPPAPHATQGCDPRRGPLPSAASNPFPALRAPTAMATSLPVRVTPNTDTGSAGSPVRPQRPLPRRAPTSPDRHAQPRGIEPLAVRRDGDRCGVPLSFHPRRRVEFATRAPLPASRNPSPPNSCCRPPSSCRHSRRKAASTFGGQLQHPQHRLSLKRRVGPVRGGLS